jgi:asparagine synthase (glutamine-hydrolysing)
MCGIYGYVSNKYIDLKRMGATILHRGPDAQGLYNDKNVGLGHNRLSILDLSRAADQPMTSRSGRYVITYNGEIYNFQVLKKKLERMGVNFSTNSDTEVILEGFEQWGVELFKDLNGMFAFAIYDKKFNKIYIARDRFGIKPLYFYHKHQDLIFSSEIKAILASEIVNTSLDYQAFHEYLHYSTSLGKSTFYRDIKKLEPGHYIEYQINTHFIEIKKYNLNYDVEKSSDTLEESVIKARNLFEDAVRSQLISDVPVGVFLSGGVDSTAITAYATKHYNGTIKTFSAGFDFDKGVNELPNARYISNYFNTEHYEFNIKGDNIPSILEELNTYCNYSGLSPINSGHCPL